MKAIAFSILSAALFFSTTNVQADDFSIHLDKYAKLDDSRVLPKFKKERTDLKATQNIEFLRFENGWRVEVEAFKEERVPSLEIGWLNGAKDLLIIAWEIAPSPKGNSHIFFHTIVIIKYQNDKEKCRQLLRMRFNANISAMDDFTIHTPFFTFDTQTNRLVELLMVHTYIASEENAPLLKRIPSNLQHKFAAYQAGFDVKYQIEYAIGEESLELGDVKMWYFTQKDDTIEEIGLYFFGQTWTPSLVKGPNQFLNNVESTDKLPANMKVEIAATREYFETFVRRHLVDTKLEYTSQQNE